MDGWIDGWIGESCGREGGTCRAEKSNGETPTRRTRSLVPSAVTSLAGTRSLPRVCCRHVAGAWSATSGYTWVSATKEAFKAARGCIPKFGLAICTRIIFCPTASHEQTRLKICASVQATSEPPYVLTCRVLFRSICSCAHAMTASFPSGSCSHARQTRRSLLTLSPDFRGDRID